MDSLFTLSVPGNGTWRAYTNESNALKTGWVILDSTDDLNPVAVFSLNSRTTGLLSEAAVFVSYPATQSSVFESRVRTLTLDNGFGWVPS